MFQATNTPATSAGEGSLPERRAWVRYPCTLEASCRLPANTCTAWVRDISTHRVKLLLNRGIEPGTLISVQVLARAGWVRHLLVARVLQAMVLPGSGWFIGCAWVYPLGENVLRTLASGPA